MNGAGDRSRAFTLIEVLLALALLAGVTGAAMGLLSNLTRRQEHIRAHSERSLGGGLLIDRLERALATSYAQDGAGEAGVKGDGRSIRVLHRGVIGHSELPGGDRRAFDLRWSETDRNISVTFSGDGAEGASEILADRVERLRLRYFSGARWRSSFDSVSAGELPSAVEIAIWFERAGAENDALHGGSLAPPGGAMDDPFALAGEPDEDRALPTRRPDRVRVMVVPDAPSASWEVGG